MLRPILHPLEELRSLLHNGQVGRKIRVKYIVYPYALQRRNQPLFRGDLRGQVKHFSPSCPNRRRHLHHNGLIGIIQSAAQAENCLGIVPGTKGVDGTVGDALAAQSTVRLLNGTASGYTYSGMRTGTDHIPDAKGLHLLADRDAAHALDALALIADQREGIIPVVRRIDMPEIHGVIHIDGVRHLLKLAGLVPIAGRTVDPMLAQQQLNIGAPCLPDLLGIGMDLHSLDALVVAGRDQVVSAFQLHHAYPTCADLIDILQEAEGGDRKAGLLCGLQNGASLRHCYGDPVDHYIYHSFLLPPLKIPQPK